MHIAAVQQPWVCFIENVENIMTIHDGAVWDAVLGMAAAAGFVMEAHGVCASEPPARLPQRRRRAYMVLVRSDVHERWGHPVAVDEKLPRLHLSDVLRSVPDEHEVWLSDTSQVQWRDQSPPWQVPEDAAGPVVVGEVDGGGWGKRVYAHMVPATKASSWGQAGRTHLVAQRRRGVWWARRLLREEIERIFRHDQVSLVLAENDDRAIAELGNAGPVRMIRPWALGIVEFLRPPLPWCPVRMRELITEEERQVCQGWMGQAEVDFTHMRHLR